LGQNLYQTCESLLRNGAEEPITELAMNASATLGVCSSDSVLCDSKWWVSFPGAKKLNEKDGVDNIQHQIISTSL